MALNLKEIKRHAKEYVEIEAHATVLGVRFVKRYRLFGREDLASSYGSHYGQEGSKLVGHRGLDPDESLQHENVS